MHSKGLIPTSTSYPFLLLHPYHAACHHSPMELCAGDGHQTGPIMLHCLKTLGPRSATAKEEGQSRQGFSALLTAEQDIPPHHLSCTHSSSSAALPLAGMLPRAAGTTGAEPMPASLLLPTWCYSFYVSPNKLDKTSLRMLLEKP